MTPRSTKARAAACIVGLLLSAGSAAAQVVGGGGVVPGGAGVSAGGPTGPLFPAYVCIDNINQDACLLRVAAGVLQIGNAATPTGFTRLVLGTNNAAVTGASLNLNGGTLEVKTGDATAFAPLKVSALTVTTPLGAANGGTGVANNAASTLAISGAFGTTLTVTGVTTVTLPTSGTLQTTTGTPAGFVIGSQAVGDLLYADSTTSWARRATVAAGQVLVSGTTPGWSGTPSLTSTAVGNGTVGCPALSFTTDGCASSGTGFYLAATGILDVSLLGTGQVRFVSAGGTTGLLINQNSSLFWGASGVTSPDTNFSRSAAGKVVVGTGAVGSAAGTLQAASYSLALAHASPANQTGNATATFKMNGLGAAAAPCTITPTSTGRVLFNITGQMTQNTTADGVTIKLAEGTGTAPANAAAASGTVISATQTWTALTGQLTSQFSIEGTATGLALATAVWFDLQVADVTGGTASVVSIDCTAHEL